MDQQIADGYEALDYNEIVKLTEGFGVRTSVGSGCTTSASTNMDVTVADGEVLFDGSPVSVAQQTVTIPAADSTDPRKDVLYIDSTGSVKIAQGSPAPAKPAGKRDRETFQPAPADLATIDGVPVAEVWVGAGVTSIESGDIRDRRLDIDVVLGSVSTEGLRVSTGQFIESDAAKQKIKLDDPMFLGSDLDNSFRPQVEFNANYFAVNDTPDKGGGTLFQVDENGGPTRMNTDLRVPLPTSIIGDSNGNAWIKFGGRGTAINDSDGEAGFVTNANNYNRIYARSDTDIEHYDASQGQIASRYISGGTWRFDNSNIRMLGNQIKNLSLLGFGINGKTSGEVGPGDTEGLVYVADGNGSFSEGDLVYEYNKNDDKRSIVLAAFSNMS